MRGDIVFVDLEVSSDPERREILDMGAIKENEGEFHKVSLVSWENIFLTVAS